MHLCLLKLCRILEILHYKNIFSTIYCFSKNKILTLEILRQNKHYKYIKESTHVEPKEALGYCERKNG